MFLATWWGTSLGTKWTSSVPPLVTVEECCAMGTKSPAKNVSIFNKTLRVNNFIARAQRSAWKVKPSVLTFSSDKGILDPKDSPTDLPVGALGARRAKFFSTRTHAWPSKAVRRRCPSGFSPEQSLEASERSSEDMVGMEKHLHGGSVFFSAQEPKVFRRSPGFFQPEGSSVASDASSKAMIKMEERIASMAEKL